MSKGQKTSPEVIYNVMVAWAETDNYAEVARRFDVPETTVQKIVKDHKDEPRFVELCSNIRKTFAEKAEGIMEKAFRLLDRRFERALKQEEELDTLIDQIYASDRSEFSNEEKQMLAKKIRNLQLHDIKAISTTIGTLYDRKALCDGNATERVVVEVKMPEGSEDYGG